MKRRIIICLSLLLALCLLGDVIAMLCLRGSIRQFRALVDSHRIQSMRVDLVAGGVGIESDLLASLAGHTHPLTEREDSIRRFQQSLESCGSCHHEPPAQTRLDRVREVYQAYQDTVDQLEADRGTKQADLLTPQAHELADELVVQVTELSDLARRHLEARGAEAAARVHNAWLVLTGAFVAALLAAGVVAVHLKRRLTRPVEELLNGVERVRKGDLTHRFAIDADEEFRVLATAFNQAYRSLKSAQEDVVQAEKMAAVGTLAAGVAHEVNNPLASISLVAQMMRRQCRTAEEKERIDLIMEHIGRISRIVRELLTFSHPARNETQDYVEIGKLLDHATTLLKYDERTQSVRISCQCDTDLKAIRGDADRLLLVFTNIIVNALEALCTRPGDGEFLAISARQRGEKIAVQFEDNGPGMTQEQINSAFEPFFTTKEAGAGTGLGLWACYQVIQKHDGTIRIDSHLGKGTTITIELPCAPVSHRAMPVAEQGVRPKPSPSSST